MRYSGIKWTDSANGVGVRISLFVSGCPHRCKGCFNQDTWSYTAGEPFTPQVAEKLQEKLGLSYIHGLSLLGGEPLSPPNQEDVLQLLQDTKARYPQKDIWCYTGYLFEDLRDGKVGDLGQGMLDYIDVLVDGLFLEERKDLALRFRGSDNQRIIDLAPTMAEGVVHLWESEFPADLR